MKRFRDFSIQHKILSGYYFILIFSLCLGIYFIFSAKQIMDSSRMLEVRNFPSVDIITELARNTRILRRLEGQKESKEFQISSQKANQLISEYAELIRLEPEGLKRVGRINELFGHLEGGEIRVAEELERELNDLRNEEISTFSLALGKISTLTLNTRNLYFWLLLVNILVSVGLACLIARMIIGPIKNLVLAMRKLGNGNLDYQIKIETEDELGTLQEGFMAMAERLKHAYSSLQQERDALDKRVQERTHALEESQLHLKMITDGINEGIMLIDKDHKILWVNKEILKFTQKNEAEILGKKCYEVTHRMPEPPAAEDANDLCPLGETIKTGKPAIRTHVHYDNLGNKFYIEVIVYPLLDKAGAIKQFIHLSRDITEKKSVEDKVSKYVKSLEDAQKELQKKIAELERFASVVVDRELRMAELKKRLAEIEGRQP